jgi:hypothetical protein
MGLLLLFPTVVYWQASEIFRVLSQCDPVVMESIYHVPTTGFNTFFPKSPTT